MIIKFSYESKILFTNMGRIPEGSTRITSEEWKVLKKILDGMFQGIQQKIVKIEKRLEKLEK